MSIRVIGMAALAASCSLAIPAGAETIQHSASGLSFSLPDDWTREADGDLLTAASPGDELVVLFFVSNQSSAEAFLDGIVEELDGIVGNAEITRDVTQEQVNGLHQIYVEGTGVSDGEPIDWDLTLVVGGRASLVVVALGDLAGGADTLASIYGSITH